MRDFIDCPSTCLMWRCVLGTDPAEGRGILPSASHQGRVTSAGPTQPGPRAGGSFRQLLQSGFLSGSEETSLGGGVETVQTLSVLRLPCSNLSTSPRVFLQQLLCGVGLEGTSFPFLNCSHICIRPTGHQPCPQHVASALRAPVARSFRPF